MRVQDLSWMSDIAFDTQVYVVVDVENFANSCFQFVFYALTLSLHMAWTLCLFPITIRGGTYWWIVA